MGERGTDAALEAQAGKISTVPHDEDLEDFTMYDGARLFAVRNRRVQVSNKCRRGIGAQAWAIESIKHWR